MTKPDRRPELSDKLKRLSEGPQWFAWRGCRLRLGPVPGDARWPALAIIVHRGRFGLANVVHKDGLRALDVEWLDGGRTTAQVYIRPRDVRALAIDVASVVGDPADLVGKPVLDGVGGPQVGRIVNAEANGDRVTGRMELDAAKAAISRHPTSRLAVLVSVLALAGLSPEDER